MIENFYPTPKKLIDKMLSKIQGEPDKILEPSAGKGDILEAFTYSRDRHGYNISVIEINEDLQAILRGKGYKVIDTDFLAFSAPDKFDLIIANPPFDEGDKHLLKAINIMYCGEIIFLLNAETLKNPFTNTRQELTKRLKKLNAEIEYIPDAFVDAERKTGVEVALVYVNIERKVEDDLFAGTAKDRDTKQPELDEAKSELATGKTIYDLVAEYKQTINIGTETILNFYKSYNRIGKYLNLNDKPDNYSYHNRESLTKIMQNRLNIMLSDIRTDFWRRTLDIPEVRSRLTSTKQDEFERQLKERCYMDFTENNIRQFVINIINGYEQTLMDAVLGLFDKFTQHSWHGSNPNEENIHYFNGWKTNSAFKVNKKVIIPFYYRFWEQYSHGKYDMERDMRDTDVVMNYFDGTLSKYNATSQFILSAIKQGQTKKIISKFFEISVFKKGTIHLTFLDDDILRRFNLAACKGKKWLPCDYGYKPYGDMTIEEQDVVNSFDGKEIYQQNLNRPIFANNATQLKLCS